MHFEVQFVFIILFYIIVKYKYRAAAFSGVRSFSGVATGGSRVCSVVSCTGDTMDTCGKRFDAFTANSTARFEELSILATFPTPVIEEDLQTANSAIFPLAVKPSILPFEPTDYEFKTESSGTNTVFNFTLTNFNEELYNFAVWGRRFATDGEAADPPVSGSGKQSLIKLLLVPAIYLMLVWD